MGLTTDDFLNPNRVIQLGRPPRRIDLITSITGVTVDAAFRNRVPGQLDQIPVFFLSRSELIENKKATGRAKDLADIEELGES